MTQAAPEGEVQAGGPPWQARRWWILAVVLTGLLVVIVDTTIMNVALKTIADPHRGIGASQGELEWALNAYTLVFAGLLITFGVLGDRLGHKRVLVGGMVLFAVGSLVAAYSGTAAQLVVGRVVMGLGGAAMMPCTLAVISHVFEPKERPKAIGIWGASVGLGAAGGPVIGGLLLEHFWWGSVFLLNVFVAIVAVPAMLVLVPESRNAKPARLDPVGALLVMVAVVALVYGLIRAGDLGSWSAVTVWGPLVAGAVVLTGFVLWELRVGQPAIDMALFRTPRFAGAVTTVLLIFFAAMGQLFFGAFYLQSVKGQSPLVAGLWMVPFAVAQLIFAPRSAGLVRRFGARTVGAVGAACATASFVPFLFMTASTPMWVFGVAFFVEGVGIANIIAPMTEVVMSSVSRAKAGAASAVSNTFRQLGGAFGVAVIGTVLTGAYRAGFRPGLDRVAGLGAGVRDQISGSVTATTGYVEQNAAAHPELTGLLRPGSDAFVHAMHLATIGCVLAAGLGLVITLVLMPRHRAAAPTGQGGAPGAAADAVAATGPGGASAAARG